MRWRPMGTRSRLADLNAAEARRTAGALPGDGHAAFAVDVVDERSVEALFDAVEAQLGPVAVLACVAGGPFLTPGRRPSIIETTTENWIRTEALNARGLHHRRRGRSQWRPPAAMRAHDQTVIQFN